MIKQGDILKFKEILEKGEENLIFLAIENEDGGRVKVQAINVNLTLKPIYIYESKDLKKIEK
jgi:hypothetical protein